MTLARVYQGIHTNAYGRGGRGFRTLFIGVGGPSAEADRVGRWLQALRPEGIIDGYAANCFRLGGVTYAALARVEPGFAKDEHGREGGILVHALFVALPEDRAPGDFGKALLCKVRSFQRPQTEDQERLEAYLAQCREDDDIEIEPVDTAALQQVDPACLGALFAAVTVRPSAGTMEMSFPVGEDRLADALVGASIALPPRLRLGLRWGTGIRPSPGVSFVAHSGGAPAGPGLNSTAAGGYLAWLLKRLRAGQSGDVRAIVESWNVRSWDGLLETVARH